MDNVSLEILDQLQVQVDDGLLPADFVSEEVPLLDPSLGSDLLSEYIGLLSISATLDGLVSDEEISIEPTGRSDDDLELGPIQTQELETLELDTRPLKVETSAAHQRWLYTFRVLRRRVLGAPSHRASIEDDRAYVGLLDEVEALDQAERDTAMYSWVLAEASWALQGAEAGCPPTTK